MFTRIRNKVFEKRPFLINIVILIIFGTAIYWTISYITIIFSHLFVQNKIPYNPDIGFYPLLLDAVIIVFTMLLWLTGIALLYKFPKARLGAVCMFSLIPIGGRVTGILFVLISYLILYQTKASKQYFSSQK